MGVYDPPCSFEGFSVDAAQDTSGVAHGFAQLPFGTCGNNPPIHYFEGTGATWTRNHAHYGLVMAWPGIRRDLPAVHGFPLDDGITKRLTDGTYTSGRVLASGARQLRGRRGRDRGPLVGGLERVRARTLH